MQEAIKAMKIFGNLFDGYLEAQLFMGALEGDVFSHFDEPCSAESFSEATGCPVVGAQALLKALEYQGWLLHSDGKWKNNSMARRFLSRHSEECLADLLIFRRSMMGLDNLAALIRPSGDESSVGRRGYDFAAMARVKIPELKIFRVKTCVEQVSSFFNTEEKLTILDCGGGSGLLAASLLHAFPHSAATVFEHPSVAPVTRQCALEQGLMERLSVTEGNFLVDPLGAPYDVIIASGILDFAASCLDDFLARLRNSLSPRGILMVYATTLGKTEESHTMELSWLSGRMKGIGKSFAVGELDKALERSGFTNVVETCDGLYPLFIYKGI